MHAEFSAMIGKDGIQSMKTKWSEYVPAILRLEDQDSDESESEEESSHKALLILDRRLRSTGVGAKSHAVFSKFDVSVSTIFMCITSSGFKEFLHASHFQADTLLSFYLLDWNGY